MFHKWAFVFKTRSPLHIGAGHKLTTMDYATFADKVYVLSEDRLFHALEENGLAEQFTTELSVLLGKKEARPVQSFLRSHGLLHEEFLQRVSHYGLSANSLSIGITEITPFIRDAFMRPFLPGTSLKGALRTVVLYNIAKRLKEADPAAFERQVIAPARQSSNRKRADDLIEDNLLRSFSLDNSKPGLHRDFLRTLRIGDSGPVSPDGLNLRKASVRSSRGDNDWYEKTSVLLETAAEGITFRSICSIDDDLVERFQKQNVQIPFTSPTELIEMIREFHTDFVREDKNFYETVNKTQLGRDTAGEPILHLGWGSGMLGTTLISLLPEDLRLQIRKKFFRERDTLLFPKVRRLTENNEPFGWVAVQLADMEGKQ